MNVRYLQMNVRHLQIKHRIVRMGIVFFIIIKTYPSAAKILLAPLFVDKLVKFIFALSLFFFFQINRRLFVFHLLSLSFCDQKPEESRKKRKKKESCVIWSLLLLISSSVSPVETKRPRSLIFFFKQRPKQESNAKEYAHSCPTLYWIQG